jgi:anti-anti-sigma factor
VEVTAISDTAPVTPAHPVMVALPHEIDLTNADSVGEQLAAAWAPGAAMVIADMTATTFCDSTGIRMLVLACQQATDHGTELRLLVTRPGVWRAMKAMGADLALPVYQSLHEALAGSRVRGPQARPSAGDKCRPTRAGRWIHCWAAG